MKKTMYVLLVLLFAAGCGSPENKEKTAPQTMSTQSSKAVAQGVTFDAAVNNLNQGKVQEAIILLEQLIKADPQDIRPYPLLANIYIRAGKLKDAQALLDLGTKVHPQNADLYFLLTQVQDQLGDKDAAIKSVKKSVELYRANKDEENFQKALVIYRVLSESESMK